MCVQDLQLFCGLGRFVGPGKHLIEDGRQQLTRSKGITVDKLDSYAVRFQEIGVACEEWEIWNTRGRASDMRSCFLSFFIPVLVTG